MCIEHTSLRGNPHRSLSPPDTELTVAVCWPVHPLTVCTPSPEAWQRTALPLHLQNALLRRVPVTRKRPETLHSVLNKSV